MQVREVINGFEEALSAEQTVAAFLAFALKKQEKGNNIFWF